MLPLTGQVTRRYEAQRVGPLDQPPGRTVLTGSWSRSRASGGQDAIRQHYSKEPAGCAEGAAADAAVAGAAATDAAAR